MKPEAFCPEHGPYDGSLVSCPHCIREKGGRPPAPTPLDDESTVGKFGGRPVSPGQAYSDDDDTILPGQVGAPFGEDDETVLPRREGARHGIDDDETLPPIRQRGRGFLDEPYEDYVGGTEIDQEDTSLLGWLIVKNSPYMRRGQIIKIRKGTIYGRNPNKADEVIDDGKVSGIHARIQIKEDQFVLIDLGSENGTWLNGEEISGATVIKQDDEITMGKTVFVLKTL